MPHIAIRNLNVHCGDHPILKNIHCDIPDGCIVAVVGPSGCGKTTLLKSLNRLLDLNEEAKVQGQVFIDGTDIYAPEADVLSLRKKVGFMAQRPYPLPMSIQDNVAFGPRIHALADTSPAMVEHYLRLAGLWEEVKDRLRAPAAKLSIGQQQRLALARALAVEPEVILADEPTSALDPASVKIVENQFRLLKQQYTIVLVTHILRQARRLADHILFMYSGELVEQGPAATFFTAPQDERTRAYLSGEIS
jgi:phosphate transport system ATP-binding protein